MFKNITTYTLSVFLFVTIIHADNHMHEQQDGYTICDISFDDENNGDGLAPGSKYCYWIVAKFPNPEGGVSYASKEECVFIEANAPVLTNVSINRTNQVDGNLNVSWLPPQTLDTITYPNPFYYKLSRYNGYGTSERIIETDFKEEIPTK